MEFNWSLPIWCHSNWLKKSSKISRITTIGPYDHHNEIPISIDNINIFMLNHGSTTAVPRVYSPNHTKTNCTFFRCCCCYRSILQVRSLAPVLCMRLFHAGIGSYHLTQRPPSQSNYREVSNIRRTESPNINISCLVLQLSQPNPLKPDVKLRMKM